MNSEPAMPDDTSPAGVQLVVMIYDVACDKRRARVHALLKEYGVPVQKSGFEARLTIRERSAVLARVGRLLHAARDRFVLYVIGRDQERSIIALGQPRPKACSVDYFIV